MRRKGVHGPRADVSPVQREFDRVWGGVAEDSSHPFGPGRPFPDFESWCAARAALGETLDSFGLTTEEFAEVD